MKVEVCKSCSNTYDSDKWKPPVPDFIQVFLCEKCWNEVLNEKEFKNRIIINKYGIHEKY